MFIRNLFKLIVLFSFLMVINSCTNSNLENNNSYNGQAETGYPAIIPNNISDSYPEPESSNKEINPEDIVIFPNASQPESEMSSFSGILYSYSIKQIISNNAFYFNACYWGK